MSRGEDCRVGLRIHRPVHRSTLGDSAMLLALVVGLSGCGEEFSPPPIPPENPGDCEPSQAPAPWWTGSARYRQPLTLTNHAPVALDGAATVVATIDTAELVDAGKLEADCADLQVVYHPSGQPAVEVPRQLGFAPSAGCADGHETRVFFRLQAPLAVGASTTDYALYYSNTDVQLVPAQTEGVFDAGEAAALMTCAFDGSAACLSGQEPEDERGAVRYAGAGTALSFSAPDAEVAVAWDGEPMATGTFETLVWLSTALPAEDDRVLGIASNTAGGRVTGAFSLAFESDSGQLRVMVDDGTTITTHHSVRAAWEANRAYHVALSWGAGLLGLYVDGELDVSFPLAHALFASSSTLWLGTTADGPLYGALDEVRVSNIARYVAPFTAPTAPFHADSMTELLLHFDENGAEPRLDAMVVDASVRARHGTKLEVAYVAGPPGHAYAQPFAYHGGVLIESGAQNLLANSSFDHPSEFDWGWTASGGVVGANNTELTGVRFGARSARLAATATGQWTSTPACPTIAPHALSAYVRLANGEPVTEAVVRLVWQGTTLDAANDGVQYYDEGHGWWRLIYAGDAIGATTAYGIELGANVELYLDGIQLERSALPTSYLDGSLGEGYEWDGDCNGEPDAATPHESSSVRLGIDDAGGVSHVLAYTNDGLVVPAMGAVSLWFRPEWDATEVANEGHSLLQAGYGSGWGPGFNLGYSPSHVGMNVFNPAGSPGTAVNLPVERARHHWYHVVASWDGANGTIYCNGESATGPWGFTEPSEGLHIGGGAGWTGAANALIGDLRIYDGPLGAADVEALYHASLVAAQPHCEEVPPPTQ